jgi:flagellar hook protein FlgE
MTAFSSAGRTYADSARWISNHRDLWSYNIDSNGNSVAQYEQTASLEVKGQVLLAYFNNVEGLIPNGNNTFEASSAYWRAAVKLSSSMAPSAPWELEGP